jgi:hypothetical protein
VIARFRSISLHEDRMAAMGMIIRAFGASAVRCGNPYSAWYLMSRIQILDYDPTIASPSLALWPIAFLPCQNS